MRTSARITGALAVSVLALGLTACGDSDDDGSATDDTSSEATSDAPEVDASAPECTAEDITVEGDFGTKPTVTLPDDCAPPTELLTKDLSVGEGPAAELGGTVDSDYLLVTWSNGEVLDNSFDRGETFPVTPLGQAPVIDGWNQGLVGMTEGSRRLIVIPPDLGYGAGGNGIAPDETLVFVVDAVGVS